jgi:hypothetical protein
MDPAPYPGELATPLSDSRCFRVPPRRRIHPHTVLYEPNPIDQWVVANEPNVYRTIFSPGSPSLSDVPHNQVLCTLVLAVTEVTDISFITIHSFIL